MMRSVPILNGVKPMKPHALQHAGSLSLNRAQAKLALRLVPAQTLDSGVLFAGSSEVVIAHGEEIYRLRLTRQNRLILTK